MTTIYLGMALRGAPKWWTGPYQKMVRHMLSCIAGVTEVTQFVGLQADRTDIYEQDIGLATQADLMVALTRYPSLGLGMELQARIDRGVPTLVFHPVEYSLSGMVETAPQLQVFEYSTVRGRKEGVAEASFVAVKTYLYLHDL